MREMRRAGSAASAREERPVKEEVRRPAISLALTPEQRERLKRVMGQDLAALELAREVAVEAAGIPRFRVTPDREFFQRAGIYLAPGFLEPELCTRLCAEVRTAEGAPGMTYVPGDGELRALLDLSMRRNTVAEVAAATASL